MRLRILNRWLIVPLVAMVTATGFASVPPAAMRYSPLALYDGPGRLCMSGFSVDLREGEFALLRKPVSYRSIFQIELVNTRLVIDESFSGSPVGTPVRAVGRGQLLIRTSDEGVIYSYADGLPGVTEISGPGLTGDSSDRGILDRITFEAPISGTTACIRARLEEPYQ